MKKNKYQKRLEALQKAREAQRAVTVRQQEKREERRIRRAQEKQRIAEETAKRERIRQQRIKNLAPYKEFKGYKIPKMTRSKDPEKYFKKFQELNMEKIRKKYIEEIESQIKAYKNDPTNNALTKTQKYYMEHGTITEEQFQAELKRQYNRFNTQRTTQNKGFKETIQYQIEHTSLFISSSDRFKEYFIQGLHSFNKYDEFIKDITPPNGDPVVLDMSKLKYDGHGQYTYLDETDEYYIEVVIEFENSPISINITVKLKYVKEKVNG